MVMQSMRSGASGGILKYFLMGMLGMAVGGLVVMDVGGVFRSGGVGSNDVVKVADKTVNIRDFDAALRRQLANYGMTPQQAYQIGVVDEVLGGQVRGLLLQKEAERHGIEIPKDQMAQHIAEAVKPYKQDDETLQDTLEGLLLRQGMSEQQFIDGIKREMSSDILKNAVKAGFTPDTDLLSKELYRFQNQTRDVELIVFSDDDITDIEPGTPENLKSLYEATKALLYSVPEYRSVQIALYDPEAAGQEFTVTEEEIKAAYDENEDSFMLEEQYVLSQAILEEEKQAQEVYASVQDGADLKDAVNNKGRFLEQIKFETSAMLPVLSDALKDKEIGEVTEPVKTTLGYHVVKLVDVIPPSLQPFEEVKESIRTELVEMKQSDYFFEVSTAFDRMLNDGVAFEEIAKEIDIEIIETPFVEAKGMDKEGKPGVEGFDEEDTTLLVQSVFEIIEGEPSILQELPSGKFVAIAIKETQAATFKPFEEVKDALAKQFESDQRRAANKERMLKYLAEISTGGSTLASIAKENNKTVKTFKALPIQGEFPEDLAEQTRPVIFQTPVGGHAPVHLDNESILIKVTSYDTPEIDENAATQIASIQEQIETEAADEAFMMYIHGLSQKYPATVNDFLLESVYGQQDDN